MSYLLTLTAVACLLFLVLSIRERSISIAHKVILSTVLICIAFICFLSVYGAVGAVICSLFILIAIGLVVSIIAGKAASPPS